MSQLSTNLEKIRKKLGFSQENVAGFLNVSHTILSNYETDKREPSHAHLTQLADLYGVNIADFFDEDPYNNAATIAFAFRADTLTPADLQSIAQFKRIVKNYLALNDIN
jgi:transcriptional regulator with XRE-family HTH domain